MHEIHKLLRLHMNNLWWNQINYNWIWRNRLLLLLLLLHLLPWILAHHKRFRPWTLQLQMPSHHVATTHHLYFLNYCWCFWNIIEQVSSENLKRVADIYIVMLVEKRPIIWWPFCCFFPLEFELVFFVIKYLVSIVCRLSPQGREKPRILLH